MNNKFYQENNISVVKRTDFKKNINWKETGFDGSR